MKFTSDAEGYQFRDLENVLYIDHEICLDSSRDTDMIRSWLEEKTGISTVANITKPFGF